MIKNKIKITLNQSNFQDGKSWLNYRKHYKQLKIKH